MDILNSVLLLLTLCGSVAEFAEKPLYRVTCGDIGTDAQRVENYLNTILHLGKIWDCGEFATEKDLGLQN
jgi:hypothetical protein